MTTNKAITRYKGDEKIMENFNDILEILFNLIILPIIPLVLVYLRTFIQAKTDELKAKTNNEIVDKYLDMANEILLRCVTETTQVYVDECKKEGSFTKESQQIAFEMTRTRFEEVASEEIKTVIKEMTNDYEAWISASIETLVNQQNK